MYLRERDQAQVLRPPEASTLQPGLLAVVLVTFALSALASWTIAAVESAPVQWPPLADLARGIGAGWLVLGMWCLLGVLLGTLVRGTALAIGLGLVWALVLENLVRGVAALLDPLDALQKLLPGGNAGSLVAALDARAQGEGGGAPGVVELVSGGRATVGLAVYVVTFGGLAALLLHRRDVT